MSGLNWKACMLHYILPLDKSNHNPNRERSTLNKLLNTALTWLVEYRPKKLALNISAYLFSLPANKQNERQIVTLLYSTSPLRSLKML